MKKKIGRVDVNLIELQHTWIGFILFNYLKLRKIKPNYIGGKDLTKKLGKNNWTQKRKIKKMVWIWNWEGECDKGREKSDNDFLNRPND